VNSHKGELEAIDKIDGIEDENDADLVPFKTILLDHFHKSQAQKKERFKEEIMSELNVIKSKLNELLDENNRVSEIERLERDEFVIDIEKQARSLDEGEQTCEDIRKEAEKTVLKLELLRDRVVQKTWEKMEIPSKAVKSIKGDTLIFNYSLRKKTPEESKRLQQIVTFRKCELREKIARIEAKITEVLDQADFSRVKEQYIMNRIAGKPSYDED
jgi:hypothetical protein